MINWCWEQIKKPLVQFVCILILVAGYWTWDITFTHQGETTQVQMEMQADTTIIPELYDEYQRFSYMMPPSFGDSVEDSLEEPTREPSSAMNIPDDIDEMSDREYRLYLWDMVLGHLSSILGSIAALCTPIITWYYQRKKK